MCIPYIYVRVGHFVIVVLIPRYIYIYNIHIYTDGFAVRVLLYIVWVCIKGGQVFFLFGRVAFSRIVCLERPAKDKAPGGL